MTDFLNNNQIGRIQLMVQALTMANKAAEREDYKSALAHVEDLTMAAVEWSDLDRLSDYLKTLYNTGNDYTLTPLTRTTEDPRP